MVDRNLRISKLLKLACLAMSALTAALIGLPPEMGSIEGISWAIIFCGVFAALLCAIQLIIVDEKVSFRLLQVVRDFGSVKEKSTLLFWDIVKRDLSADIANEKIEQLYGEYTLLKDKYLENIELNHGYYGFWEGRGRLESHAECTSQHAMYWLMRAHYQEPTRDERSALVAWLRRAPENIEELLQTIRTDGRSGQHESRESGAKDALSKTTPPSTGASNDAYFAKDPPESVQRIALSVSYLHHLEARHRRWKWALGISSFGLSTIAVVLGNASLAAMAATTFVVLLLVIGREQILGYRISNGFFGHTTEEARDFIRFILENIEDIDFTDGTGGRRKSLVPQLGRSNAGDAQMPVGVHAR